MNTLLVASSNGRSRANSLSRWSRLALSLLVLGLPLCAGVLGVAPARALAMEQRAGLQHAHPQPTRDVVRNGQVVALLSNQARASSPHREVSAFRHGRPVDPAIYSHHTGH